MRYNYNGLLSMPLRILGGCQYKGSCVSPSKQPMGHNLGTHGFETEWGKVVPLPPPAQLLYVHVIVKVIFNVIQRLKCKLGSLSSLYINICVGVGGGGQAHSEYLNTSGTSVSAELWTCARLGWGLGTLANIFVTPHPPLA